METSAVESDEMGAGVFEWHALAIMIEPVARRIILPVVLRNEARWRRLRLQISACPAAFWEGATRLATSSTSTHLCNGTLGRTPCPEQLAGGGYGPTCSDEGLIADCSELRVVSLIR